MLRAVPVRFWLTLALFAVVLGASWERSRAIDAADARGYARGYARAIANARFDSTLHQMADSARGQAAAKTDTILRVVTQRVTKIKTVTVPDTVRVAFPVVDTLVIESQALAHAVDSLVVAITQERAATKVALDLRDAAIRDSRLENARLSAQNAALQKRPTRFQTFAVGVASAAGGVIAGKVL